MNSALEQLVWERAKGRRENCPIGQELDELIFEIDHIVPRRHQGKTAAGNLALACFPWK